MMYLSELLETDKLEKAQLIQLCEILWTLLNRERPVEPPKWNIPNQPLYIPPFVSPVPLNTTPVPAIPEQAKIWCQNGQNEQSF